MRCRRSSTRRPGRVHTTFNQAVAATGRLSSSDPEPAEHPDSHAARAARSARAFVAEPGHVLISADYSQIELRVLAHLSGDEALVEAFQPGHRHSRPHGRARVRRPDSRGLDPHELRRRAKIINYALLYGKTAFTLAKDIGVTQQAAQEFIDAYFAGYPARARLHRPDAGRRARQRRGADDHRPAAAGARAVEQERQVRSGGRARNASTCRFRAPRPTCSRRP